VNKYLNNNRRGTQLRLVSNAWTLTHEGNRDPMVSDKTKCCVACTAINVLKEMVVVEGK
jgi:hypothetical protein